MTRLILLDRDGVINHDSPDYVRDADEWLPIAGSLDAIAALKHAGYLVAVCTNQAGVGRGLFSLDALGRVHAKMNAELDRRGIVLDGLRFCPHRPDDGCNCRKPRPGMLIETMSELAIAPAETLFVGDSLRDMEAARAAGCRAALVRTGSGAAIEATARRMGIDCVADDLASLAHVLIGGTSC